MGQYIIKLTDEKSKKDYYLEWSTVVDAPVTFGMELDEFKQYVKDEYGKVGTEDLADRLIRVEQKGTSAWDITTTLDSLLSCNRAGKNEKHLTKKQIIKKYCIDKTE